MDAKSKINTRHILWRPDPKVLNRFHAQLSGDFINVKMPTIVGIFNIYEQDKLLVFKF